MMMLVGFSMLRVTDNMVMVVGLMVVRAMMHMVLLCYMLLHAMRLLIAMHQVPSLREVQQGQTIRGHRTLMFFRHLLMGSPVRRRQLNIFSHTIPWGRLPGLFPRVLHITCEERPEVRMANCNKTISNNSSRVTNC